LTEAAIALIQNARQPKSHRKIYLCGESFGGCLALKISEQAPELAYQLILSNPATAFARQSFIGFGASLTPWVPDWFYRSSTLGFLPLLIALHRTDASDRARLLRAMQSLSPESVSWRLFLLHRFQFAADRLQSQSPNILILASGSDRLMPSVAEARRLQNRLPQARIHYLPDSGHACLMERDLNLAQILKGRGLLPPLLEKVTV
jgi:pimeloyl-ACP methyl ester carboxylesterase